MTKTSKILVTGATGIVGKAIVLALAAKGNLVRAMVFEKSKIDHKLENVEWVVCDILDVTGLQDVFKGIETIYHCLEYVSFLDSDINKLYDINITGTENVVNVALALKVRKVIYISSTQAFGTYQHKEQISEKTKWAENNKNTFYGICKNRAELEIWRGKEEGLEILIVNPSIIIAPFEDKMYNIAKIAKANYQFYPSGTNGFVALKDVAEASILLNEYNISGEKFILNSENLSYHKVLTKWNEKLAKKSISSKINSLKANIIWRINNFRNVVFRAEPFLSKEIYNFDGKDFEFSNKKMIEGTNFKFTPVLKYIEEIK